MVYLWDASEADLTCEYLVAVPGLHRQYHRRSVLAATAGDVNATVILDSFTESTTTTTATLPSTLVIVNTIAIAIVRPRP